jgi:SAM-dependent methyltransferase
MPPDAKVLDVGCADGALFRQAPSVVKSGIGVDTDQPSEWPSGSYEFRRGEFPTAIGASESFDAVVMLAVIEHVSSDLRKNWAAIVPNLLRSGGRLIITVPAPLVDRILGVGIRLRLLHGMDAEHHHGFDPRVIPQEFGDPPMRLLQASRFELGLNYLFVFERS